ncbi:hypothetical protein [Natronorubrum sp. FCH18a]|uniref:hypothetical protein n=1 Tax=Natronorubrum sp. FCH18a TaxID=3447018 RepID=UPI003F511F7F
MVRREADRAVTVQIGAILLLAIVFSALALYQVNAVPEQNRGVEFDHNERVHTELQDLRNAIQNVGTEGGTQSTSVTLGTQYPTRTVATNPPAPTGTLETTGTKTIRIENATIAGNDAEYDGTPDDLLGDHETTTLAYAPSYHEYRTAPTTRIEHGFAFNDFDDAQVSLTDQPLLSDRSITLVLLEGEFSRSASGTVSLDPTALSGPSDEVPIEPDGNETITMTIPTDSPGVWNETVGTTFDDGEDGARVAGYDRIEGSGTLTIELANDEYGLRVARVGIDGAGESSDEFAVRRTESNVGGTTGVYETVWEDTTPTEVDADDPLSLTMNAANEGSAVEGASVSYAVSDDDGVIDAFDNSGTTNASGRNRTTLEFDSSAVSSDGSTIDVYVSSGGSSDRRAVRVNPPTHDSESGTDGLRWSVTDETTNDVVHYSVSYEVTDPSFEYVKVEFTNEVDDSATDEERSDSRGTVAYSQGGSAGDTYSITITAFDTNGDVLDERTVTDTADGSTPDTGDDPSSPSSPQLDGSRVDDWSQPNDDSARYFVSYDVDNRDEFDRVEASFRNRNSGAITTETDSSPRGRLEFSGNRIDDEFEIELRVYDTDGVLVDSRTYDDTADGTNPSGNDELDLATSPQFDSPSVTDGGNPGQSQYTVEYDTAESAAVGSVWAEFRNLDNAWATDVLEQSDADGTFDHDPGGGTGGDAYEITLLLFDSDGAVVDRWTDDDP